eukprot:3518081-Pleurochrysis_carterae.AAC.3
MRKAWPTLNPIHIKTLDCDGGSDALVGNDGQRLISESSRDTYLRSSGRGGTRVGDTSTVHRYGRGATSVLR